MSAESADLESSSFLALNPGSLSGGGEREPGTHCLRMCQNSQKSWELAFLSVFLTVNMNLDPTNMPKMVYVGCCSG